MKRALFGLLALALTQIAAAPAHAASAPPASFADMVEKLSPAVVNISTTQKIQVKQAIPNLMFPGMPPQQQEQFRQFFEQFGQMQGQAPEREVQSLGSGFIIDESGYVVTNNHVIKGAEKVLVTLHDNTKLEAKIIGKDQKTDLALLKVETKRKLPFVSFGDSDTARVGDWVVAIGNPFGLGGTVTAGIISARERNINAGPFDDFLQTDASINRGNSGGPMFNMNGEVIGIATAIFSPNGGSIGIGFAAPSALAQPVIAQLKQYGRTHRGLLGVKIQEVTDEIAESQGLDTPRGALVLDVSKDSPAAKAGIQVGDIILAFDGKKVEKMRQLPRIVADTKIGKEVMVSVWRKGKTLQVNAVVTEMQEDPQAAAADENAPTPEAAQEQGGYKTLGMELVAISDALRTRYNIAADVKGLLVATVEAGSEAAHRGIREGDIILQVNDAPVLSGKMFEAAITSARKAGRKSALAQVQRGSDKVFVALPTVGK